MSLPNGSGTLVVIGGAEEKRGDAEILRYVADHTDGKPLIVMTCATEEPEEAFERYRKIFSKLGVKDIRHIDVRDREDGLRDELSRPIDDAKTIFFTGGDQLRITSHIGDTPVYTRIRKLLDRGGLIAGTSAGAAVMSETMLVEGESDDTPDVAQIVQMAPGLGFLGSAIVDMHFAERGRLGRLLGAIAQNPRMLGIGIDEDTAMIVHGDCLEVMGSGGVYILDGSKSRRSNVAEAAADETLAIENVTLHLLSAHRQYDLEQRQPA